ncbi:hypothetical protein QBC42DRAFT_337110 [Cladorrhinum samala]|uniref:Peptidase C15, pyroglutamyl peptidase I-like protein n=1 Tax=Cladorrhinum samala TaxID=585594 RepID=A0AAV9HVP8_9PEZI|nr:hypothetical protein QBC42DRAFT_337110 [Cladorrhinum samala]
MGSIQTDASKEEIKVLITGFAPFKQDYPVNPSWEIVSSLPDYLPPIRPKTAAAPSSALLPPIRLLVHPEPIHVSYRTVRSLVPTLHSQKPDIVVHVGMAGPRAYYSIERRGHRDGYQMQDVDGKYLADYEDVNSDDWVWKDLPEEIETDFDCEDVLRKWKNYSPRYSDLRISEDAGHYLCDFIYFSSLAELYKKGKREGEGGGEGEVRKKVIFLHVPSDASEGAVLRGRELLLQLVRGVVECELERKKDDSKEGEEGRE